MSTYPEEFSRLEKRIKKLEEANKQLQAEIEKLKKQDKFWENLVIKMEKELQVLKGEQR